MREGGREGERGRLDRASAVANPPPPSPTPPTSTTTHARRLQLAMAVVRLVNGVADAGQTRRVAASVADLSAAAGLPRALVDLRHEATHNELPRVVALEAGAAAGLVWLEENYWRAQRGALASRFAAAAALVAEYVSLKLVAARSSAGAAAGDDSDGADDAPPAAPPAKRRRRALLGELKDAVPPGAGRLLAAVVVSAAAGLAPPTASTPLADRAGWRDAVCALARGWPGLRACLAWVAVDALERESAVAPNPAFAPFSATPPTPATCLAWLQALADASLMPADAACAAACRAALPGVAAAAADRRAVGGADAGLLADAALVLAVGSEYAGAPARTAALLGVSLPPPKVGAPTPTPKPAADAVPTTAPWAPAPAWSPCPLGALPRAGDPGGRPSAVAWTEACRNTPSTVGSRDGPGWVAAAGGAAAVAARVGLL